MFTAKIAAVGGLFLTAIVLGIGVSIGSIIVKKCVDGIELAIAKKRVAMATKEAK